MDSLLKLEDHFSFDRTLVCTFMTFIMQCNGAALDFSALSLVPITSLITSLSSSLGVQPVKRTGCHFVLCFGFEGDMVPLLCKLLFYFTFSFPRRA